MKNKLPGRSSVSALLLDAFTGSTALISVTVVLLGFLCGTLLILAIGKNPLNMYSALVQVCSGWDLRNGSWNIRYIGEWLAISSPLILCGLSMGFAGRAGLFNIGAEGQYIAGLTAAQTVALLYHGPFPAAMAVAAALGAGGVWGALVGFLKARYAVSEVVATIMLNYVALFSSRALTLMLPGTNTYRTPGYPANAMLDSPFLESLTNGSRLGLGFFLTIAALIVYSVVMGKTRLGFSLRATGLGKEAARCSGINVNASTTASMAIAGAFAGLGGAIVALGSFSYGRVLSGQDGYGFDGIAVALIGNSTAGGTAIAGLLFGLLKSAQPLMQGRGIPKEITALIIGLVVVFISLRSAVRLIADWRMKEALKKGGKHA